MKRIEPIDQFDIESYLHENGVHCTSQRRAVWDFLASSEKGRTISETVDALREVRIGQATIYRTVMLLLDLGLLYRIHSGNGETYFLATRPGHTHPLICRKCHAMIEFETCDMSVLEKLLSVQTGYAVLDHHLAFYGLCPTCQARQDSRLDQAHHHADDRESL